MSALTLLVFGILFVNDVETSFATYDFVLVRTLFD